jgi:hypothetical protein
MLACVLLCIVDGRSQDLAPVEQLRPSPWRGLLADGLIALLGQ